MRELTIEIPIEEEEPLGAIPDSKLIIVQVQANTLADGNIQIGDHVTKIKGIRIRDLNHFYTMLRYAPPLLKLTVEREDEPPAPDTPSKDERAQPSLTSSTRANLDLSAIPEERRNSVPRRSGFVYKVVDFVVKKGEHLGLHICSYQNRVTVSNTLPESVSARHLKRGDHIIDVNGARVSEKSVASNFISESLNVSSSEEWRPVLPPHTRTFSAYHLFQKTKKVSLLIARPSTRATRQEMEDDIVRKVVPPSKIMPPDVMQICARERERNRAQSQENRLPPIVVDPNTRLAQTVTFDDARGKVIPIPDDNPRKVLPPANKNS